MIFANVEIDIRKYCFTYADMGRSASIRESSWIVQILGEAIFGSAADSGWNSF